VPRTGKIIVGVKYSFFSYQQGMDMQDLIIKNAMLYDGTGAAPRLEQVAIKDGVIAALGADCGAAREVIDANGLALMPGIIDSHTHYDAQITWDPLASPSPAMGVTTVVIGNCGFTIAPCRAQDRDINLRNLTHVEGMSLDALRAGVDWSFETFPEFLAQLEKKGVGPNVAAFIGHSSVRTWVLGADASKRVATAAEVDEMRRIVLDGLQAGAVGFSTTTSYQHNGENGIPMPSRLADQHEMETLVGTLNEAQRGVFMLTKASDTKMSFLESLGQAAKRPMLVAAILHNPLVPEEVFDDMKGIAAARSRGSDMYGAVSCCPLRFEFTMHEPYVFEALPSWAPAMKVHGDDAKALFSSTEFRQGVKNELAKVARRMFTGDWGKVHVAMVADDKNKALEGKSVEELAAAAKKHPLDWMLDFALSENLDTVFTAVLLNWDETEVARLLTDPNSLVSLSDAGAHLTFLCDAAFGLHFMGHWSRDKGLMPLEHAVKKLTSDQAKFFGIKNRGVLKVGAHADMLLFDPASVGRGEGKRLFDLPAGGSRLSTSSTGLHGVWVNGTQIADGQGLRDSGNRPGKVLREFHH
jgi:N-acyl-D-amino-acid deacylase